LTLQRGVDQTKDQSYFLFGLSAAMLSKLIFPLGNYWKKDVINLAQDKGYQIKSPESQDVCFLAENSLADFFSANFSEQKKDKIKPGLIIDRQGTRLGHHRGLMFYTIGQRHGLGLGGDGPYYVVDKDVQKNTLVVSNLPTDLKKERVIFRANNWLLTPRSDRQYLLQIRYQMKPIPITLQRLVEPEGYWEARALAGKFQAVSPGQMAVVYQDDLVVGGGEIVR